MCLRAGPDEPESPAIRALMCHVMSYSALLRLAPLHLYVTSHLYQVNLRGCQFGVVFELEALVKPDVLGPVLGP
jgi:hypothetical protein